jgi:hypothetical protein
MAAGTYGGHTFNDALSSALLITVRTATVADHGTGTGWSNSYAGTVHLGPLNFQNGYYTISGATRTSMTTGYGMVVTPSASCPTSPYLGNCNAVDVQDANGRNNTHITLEYINFVGYGVNSYSSSTKQIGSFIYAAKGVPSCCGAINLTVRKDYFSDAGYCYDPILIRGLAGGLFDNIDIEGAQYNDVYCHIALFSEGGSSNVTVKNSVLENESGAGYIELRTGSNNWYIYGNVFLQDPSSPYYPTDGVGNGIVTDLNSDTGGGTNIYIYNNTIANVNRNVATGTGMSMIHGSNWIVENNLWYNSASPGSYTYGIAPTVHDYNYFTDCTGKIPSETHGQTGRVDPFVNDSAKNFHLAGPTKAGLTLPAPYNVDPDGNTRGADGDWDRGAYEFLGNETKPTPPSGLTVTGVH